MMKDQPDERPSIFLFSDIKSVIHSCFSRNKLTNERLYFIYTKQTSMQVVPESKTRRSNVQTIHIQVLNHDNRFSNVS